MKTILHTATLLYYDGVQIFEGRDLIGGHYIAALANDDNGVDTYAVVGTSPESLRRFRVGAIDLKSLMLEMPDGQWYIAQPEDGESVKIRLQPQTTSLAESDFLPDDGLVLYDDPVEDLALSEARERQNVVFEFSMSPPETARGHRVRVETLASALSHIQRMVRYSYQRASRGVSGKIVDATEIDYLMDVIIPAAPGSFRVLMEAAKPSDLFGAGRLALALECMDEVFASVSDPLKAVEGLRCYKGRLARSCINLLGFLAEVDTGLRYSWAQPNLTAARHVGISQADAKNLSRILSEVVDIGNEETVIEGELEKANRSGAGSWALLTEEGVKSGKVRQDDEIRLDGLEVGKRYRFDCVEEIEVNAVGKETRALYLKEISAV